MADKTVLIVEDEAIIAEDIAIKVERIGYKVIGTAYSSKEAEDIVASICPELVLMDINLEGPKNGIMMAKVIQSLCGNVPVVFISGSVDMDEIKRTNLQGPYSFLNKPFKESDFISMVEKMLN